MLKFIAKNIGSEHVEVRVFDGPSEGALAHDGTLIMSQEGWKHLSAIIEVASEGAPEPFNEVVIEQR